jgi:hypothetical protein
MFGGLHLEEEEFEEVNTIEYPPTMSYIDVDHARHYLGKTSIRFNKKDKISYGECNTDEINGVLHQYGGKGTTFTFCIMLRDNGVFVDWSNHYGDRKIEKVEDQ